MKGLNKVLLIGNLGADPDIRYTQDNAPVANFTVATNEYSSKKEQITEWHKCVAFGRAGDKNNLVERYIKPYLKKGSSVYIEGSLQTTSYTDRDGVKKYSTQIVVRELQGLSSSAQGDSQEAPPKPAETRQEPPQEAAQQFNPSEDFDDDIPF
tara:strand:- start:1730 stop:2188 length:459 start_codon:yes stop_codon:yes gene_type:complete